MGLVAVCTDCKVGNAVAVKVTYVCDGGAEIVITAQGRALGSRAVYLLSVFDCAVWIHE